MRRELSPERKRVVVLAASVAAMSGGGTLLRGHRILLGFWIGLMAVLLVVVIVKLAQLKDKEGCRLKEEKP